MNFQFRNNIFNFILDHIYNINQITPIHADINCINQQLENWISRKIGPTLTNTPIPNAKPNCGKKDTAKQNYSIKKWNWNVSIQFYQKCSTCKTKEITFTRIDAIAQQQKWKERKRNHICRLRHTSILIGQYHYKRLDPNLYNFEMAIDDWIYRMSFCRLCGRVNCCRHCG